MQITDSAGPCERERHETNVDAAQYTAWLSCAAASLELESGLHPTKEEI